VSALFWLVLPVQQPHTGSLQEGNGLAVRSKGAIQIGLTKLKIENKQTSLFYHLLCSLEMK